MKSKTKIDIQTKRKSNANLVETILAAKKNKKWEEIARLLSTPTKNRIIINLDKIDKNSKEKEILVIPGKVLSQGELNKKIKIVAFNFSENAKEKILKNKCEMEYILDEIKKNPNAVGIKILK